MALKLNPSGAPPEAKMVSFGGYGSITVVVAWILTAYVFKGKVPDDLAPFLPGEIGLVVGAIAGWFTRHTPREDQVVTEALKIVTQFQASQRQYVAGGNVGGGGGGQPNPGGATGGSGTGG